MIFVKHLLQALTTKNTSQLFLVRFEFLTKDSSIRFNWKKYPGNIQLNLAQL